MTDAAATIAAVTALVAALGALYLNYQNRSAAQDAKTKAAVSAAAALEAQAATERAAAAQAEAAEKAEREIIATKNGVFEVGDRLDGRLQSLLEMTASNATALGRAQGIAAEQERAASGAVSIPPAAETTPVVPKPVVASVDTDRIIAAIEHLPGQGGAPQDVKIVQPAEQPVPVVDAG